MALEKGRTEATILSSEAIIKELSTTLLKEKFNKYVHIETRLEFIVEYKNLSQRTDIFHRLEICRDPKDNMYLEPALSGNADFIISGDSDLLVLDPFRNVRIIMPKEFLERF